MPVKKQPQTAQSPAPRRASATPKSAPPAPKTQPTQPTEKFQRPAPTKVYRPQVVTHVKTMSNGQPRPKSRRCK